MLIKIHIMTLEKIQHRAARFMCNNYSNYDSVTSMLDMLNWPSLEQRRRLAILHSIFHLSTIRLWNSLPAVVVSSANIDSFKNILIYMHVYTLYRGLCII